MFHHRIQRVLHSALCSRILLHIRGAVYDDLKPQAILARSLPPTAASPISPIQTFLGRAADVELAYVSVTQEQWNL